MPHHHCIITPIQKWNWYAWMYRCVLNSYVWVCTCMSHAHIHPHIRFSFLCGEACANTTTLNGSFVIFLSHPSFIRIYRVFSSFLIKKDKKAGKHPVYSKKRPARKIFRACYCLFFKYTGCFPDFSSFFDKKAGRHPVYSKKDNKLKKFLEPAIVCFSNIKGVFQIFRLFLTKKLEDTLYIWKKDNKLEKFLEPAIVFFSNIQGVF